MHQRYNFELVKNDEDHKVYVTHSDDNDQCWIEFILADNDLQMNINTEAILDEEFDYNFWKRLKHKLQVCWKVLTDQELKYSSRFVFRGGEQVEDFSSIAYLLSKKTRR